MTGIQWTDETWNPTTGCTKVSPGCAHCYIERTPAFRVSGMRFVNGRIPVRLHARRLETPLRWKKPRRVFVNSMSDLFHEDVPNAFIDDVFGVMKRAPQHTFQILTKRPARMKAYFDQLNAEAAEKFGEGWQVTPLRNVWLGVSVENQRFADERIPLLLHTPAAVRFISAEPLLEAVELEQYLWPACIATREQHDADHGGGMWCDERSLDWVIVGGESGPGARPFDLAWARSIVKQCHAAGVACFMKQLGRHPETRSYCTDDGARCEPPHGREQYGRNPLHLNDSQGGVPAEWPEDLRIREFPA